MGKVASCDPTIYAKGTHVALIASLPALLVEAIVQEASERAGFKIDWHYIGGRANVLTLGDPAKASACILNVLDALPMAQWNCGGRANDIPTLDQQRRSFASMTGRTS